MPSKKLLTLILLMAFLITSGLGCKNSQSAEQAEAMKPIILNYWRVHDDSDSFDEIIIAYKALHPNIAINYRKLRAEEFQTELLNALAEDRGPDMFSINNTWLRAYQSKIYPLPPALRVAFQRIEGTYQKKTVVEIKKVASPTVKQVQDKYISAVADNVVFPGIDPKTNQASKMIYGLPLAADTLALFYNKTLLDQAGIPEPPRTWDDFQKDVKLLTKIDAENNILQSGAALGVAKNVLEAADILALLMMQNGTVMANDAGYPTFHQVPAELASQNIAPAVQALQFYTDFAQPTKEVYSWNEKMPESLDAFARGQTAFFFGYSYYLPIIRARAPRLNLNIVPLPQVNPQVPVNFASFWVETVSKKTPYPDAAWDFIVFAANPKNVVKYLNKTKKPTALRELVAGQIEDPDIGVFASNLLTAKSWYKGKDADLTKKYFGEMIDSVFAKEAINDPEAYYKAVNTAAAKVGQTL